MTEINGAEVAWKEERGTRREGGGRERGGCWDLVGVGAVLTVEVGEREMATSFSRGHRNLRSATRIPQPNGVHHVEREGV